jgi:hypothetical protein
MVTRSLFRPHTCDQAIIMTMDWFKYKCTSGALWILVVSLEGLRVYQLPPDITRTWYMRRHAPGIPAITNEDDLFPSINLEIHSVEGHLSPLPRKWLLCVRRAGTDIQDAPITYLHSSKTNFKKGDTFFLMNYGILPTRHYCVFITVDCRTVVLANYNSSSTKRCHLSWN